MKKVLNLTIGSKKNSGNHSGVYKSERNNYSGMVIWIPGYLLGNGFNYTVFAAIKSEFLINIPHLRGKIEGKSFNIFNFQTEVIISQIFSNNS